MKGAAPYIAATWVILTTLSPKLSHAEVEQIRVERETASEAFYPNSTVSEVQAAALKVLNALDPSDVVAEAANGKILGIRNYSIYQVFRVTYGVDYYEVIIEPQEGGTVARVRFDRSFNGGLITSPPPQTYKEGLGIYGRQGATIDDYRIFHSRLNAVLSQAPWPECKGLTKIEKQGALFMCNAPGLNHKAPPVSN